MASHGLGGRFCEGCGYRMPMFSPRRRHPNSGLLLCPGCHPDGAGSPGMPVVHGAKTASGDCPECGAALMVGPSTGDSEPFKCSSCELTGRIDRNGDLRWGRYDEVGGGVEAAKRKQPESLANTWRDLGVTDFVEEANKERDAREAEEKKASRRVAVGETCPRCGGPVADDFRLPGEGGAAPFGYAFCPTCGIVEAPRTTGGLRSVAHDSGDGKTIYHCPFCGGGNVIARSDGTTECGFCQTAFTVQVQPMHPNMPQTIDGVPVNQPGMPGEPGVPGEVPSEPGSQGDSTVFEPPGATAPVFQPPDQPAGGAPAQPPVPVAASRTATRGFFITAKGVALDADAYIRHLAIQHADDRDVVIEQVRQSRG